MSQGQKASELKTLSQRKSPLWKPLRAEKYEGRERKGLELGNQTGAEHHRDRNLAGLELTRMKTREQRSHCGIRKTQVPPAQASLVLTQAPVRELRVHPSFLAFPVALQIGPLTSCLGRPAGRTRAAKAHALHTARDKYFPGNGTCSLSVYSQGPSRMRRGELISHAHAWALSICPGTTVGLLCVSQAVPVACLS